MPQKEDIPHLINLLDDDAPWIRQQVMNELVKVDPYLEEDYEVRAMLRTDRQRLLFEQVCRRIRYESLDEWKAWLSMESNLEALTYAFEHLSYLRRGILELNFYSLLEELHNEFLYQYSGEYVESLLEFMFGDEGFSTHSLEVNNPDFYDLQYVMESHRGDQLSLSILCILIGRMSGIDLHGLNVPGHFLLAYFEEGALQLFNVLNNGHPISRTSVLQIERSFESKGTSVRQELVTQEEMVIQTLQQIIHVHNRRRELGDAAQYTRMLDFLIHEIELRDEASKASR